MFQLKKFAQRLSDLVESKRNDIFAGRPFARHGRESSFFSFYEISEKGTSWMGLLTFSVIVASTGSYRQAILAVIVFFLIGGLILFFTDTTRAIHEAGNLTPEEAVN